MKVKAKMRYINKWVYGKLVKKEYLKECVDDEVEGLRAIDPCTISEETNVTNANGTKIFVNDIVSRRFKRGVVVKKYGKYYIKWSSKNIELLTNNMEIDILGNKFE